MLDKDTIKNEILPHLSKAKRGYVTQSCLIEVVNAILYKLKTGCQWAFLPVEDRKNFIISGNHRHEKVMEHNHPSLRRCSLRLRLFG